MARIEIVNDGTVRECAEGANLLAELLRAGAFVDNPCNGTGVCGKCKVRIVDGEVSKYLRQNRNYSAERSWRRVSVWHV